MRFFYLFSCFFFPRDRGVAFEEAHRRRLDPSSTWEENKKTRTKKETSVPRAFVAFKRNLPAGGIFYRNKSAYVSGGLGRNEHALGGGRRHATEHLGPSGLDENNEARSKVSPFSVYLPPSVLVFSLALSLALFHVHTLHATPLHSHARTRTHAERQNLFISSLYADCAQSEIAGLTPCCELSRGNVYPNPSECAINLFLDRRQTRMSLHEGNKDANAYPRPSWQSSHYEAAGGSNDPGSPLSQGLSLSLSAAYRCA